MEIMLNNPFVLVGDIPTPYFCDRQQEINRLVRGLYSGENICLVSSRRMGKSKLVKHCSLLPEIKDHYYFFYVDLLHTSSLRDLHLLLDAACLMYCKIREKNSSGSS